MYNDETIIQLCDTIGISYKIFEHAPLFTVEDSQNLRGVIAGTHIRNLFLRDKKKNYYLISVEENSIVDLKLWKNILQANGNFSFANADTLWEYMGVKPGSVTPLCMANVKADKKVTFVMDNNLRDTKIINVHPLRNDMTIAIYDNGLHKFFAHFNINILWADFAHNKLITTA